MPPIDTTEMTQARAGMSRVMSELGSTRQVGLTPGRDERNHDSTLYWLEKARDAVSELGKRYWRNAAGNVYKDEVMDSLLDAESAVEDRIFEYRQAWEAVKGREAGDYMDDDRR